MRLVRFASKVQSEHRKVRRAGSQGQGRSEAEHAAPGIIRQSEGALKGPKPAVQHDFCRPFRPETLLYPIQGLCFACPWLPYLRAFSALLWTFEAKRSAAGTNNPPPVRTTGTDSPPPVRTSLVRAGERCYTSRHSQLNLLPLSGRFCVKF